MRTRGMGYMAESKKFFWLKLKRDFFKRHDIRIVESMPNGKEYILFYIKMLAESIDHEGTLRFSDTIPYSEEMLSALTNTDIDIVKSAMEVFAQLDMVQVFEDKTIYMTQVEKLIGSETEWAKKKREQRTKKDNVPLLSPKCPTEMEKDKEKETDTEIESEREQDEDDDSDPADNQLKPFGKKGNLSVVFLTDNQVADLLDKLGLEAFDRYVDRLGDYIVEKDAHIKNHYETILKWHRQDSRVKP